MLSIRNAGIGDIPLIRELTYKVWPQTYADILSPEQIAYMLEMMYSESSLQKQMADGCQFIIVNAGTNPVGFASYQAVTASVYKLHKIYVLGAAQGKGAGRFIIDHIIPAIKKKGAAALQLQVNRNNKAKLFYEKLGFEIIMEADFAIGNGYFMRDYIMEKKI